MDDERSPGYATWATGVIWGAGDQVRRLAGGLSSTAAAGAYEAWTQRVSAATDLSARLEAAFGVVEVPVVILPTGADADDYIVLIDVGPVVDALGGGRLPRSRMVLYCGRDDLQRDLLADRVECAFLAELSEVRRPLAESLEKEVEQAQSDAESAAEGSREHLRAAGDHMAMVGALSVALLLVTNPAVDLLLLALAVGGGADTLRSLWGVVERKAAGRRHANAEHRSMVELEQHAESERATVRSRLAGMRLHRHAELVAVARGIAENEQRPAPAATTDDSPPLGEILDEQRVHRAPGCLRASPPRIVP